LRCVASSDPGREPPALLLVQAPPAVAPVPAAAAHFVLATTAAAPGVAVRVWANVSDDAGTLVFSVPSADADALTVTGLTPGTNYTLHAGCVDALNATCEPVSHRWRSAACLAPATATPAAQREVSVGPGRRYVAWASPALAFKVSVDGGAWAPVPEVHPGVPPQGMLVRGVWPANFR
jgi:hypothetical protein